MENILRLPGGSFIISFDREEDVTVPKEGDIFEYVDGEYKIVSAHPEVLSTEPRTESKTSFFVNAERQ